MIVTKTETCHWPLPMVCACNSITAGQHPCHAQRAQGVARSACRLPWSRYQAGVQIRWWAGRGAMGIGGNCGHRCGRGRSANSARYSPSIGPTMTETTDPGGSDPAPVDPALPDRLPADGQSITARRAITAPATVDLSPIHLLRCRRTYAGSISCAACTKHKTSI